MSKNLTPLYFEEHFEHCEGSLYDGDDFVIWLAEHDTGVAEAERERIVELLRSKVKTVNMDWINWIIELIRGEN